MLKFLNDTSIRKKYLQEKTKIKAQPRHLHQPPKTGKKKKYGFQL